jgi:hypothetical protein
MTIERQRRLLIAEWRKLQLESISHSQSSALDFVRFGQIDEQLDDLMLKIVALD